MEKYYIKPVAFSHSFNFCRKDNFVVKAALNENHRFNSAREKSAADFSRAELIWSFWYYRSSRYYKFKKMLAGFLPFQRHLLITVSLNLRFLWKNDPAFGFQHLHYLSKYRFLVLHITLFFAKAVAQSSDFETVVHT